MKRCFTLYVVLFASTITSEFSQARVSFTTGPFYNQSGGARHDDPFGHMNRIDTIKRMAGISHNNSHGYYPVHGPHAAAMLYNPASCAGWTEYDYYRATVEAFGIAVPASYSSSVTSDYVECAQSDDKSVIIYLHDSHRCAMMQQTQLYGYENYWNQIRKYPDYEHLLPQIHAWVHNNSDVHKKISRKGFANLEHKHSELIKKQELRAQAIKDAHMARQATLRESFNRSIEQLETEAREWKLLTDCLNHAGLSSTHIQKRSDALEATRHSAHYTEESFVINADATGMLSSRGCNPSAYTKQYGNQLQHTLHKECIELISRSVALPVRSPLYSHKGSLVDITDSAREFNQIGECHKTSMLNDFTYALLDYGSAIAEGVAQGIIGAAQDMIEHPFLAVACIVAGEYVLVYQLAKIMLQLAGITEDLAEIGITYSRILLA